MMFCNKHTFFFNRPECWFIYIPLRNNVVSFHPINTEIQETMWYVNVEKEVIYFINVLTEILLIQERKHILEKRRQGTREQSEHE